MPTDIWKFDDAIKLLGKRRQLVIHRMPERGHVFRLVLKQNAYAKLSDPFAFHRQKSFDPEGEALKHALTKSLHLRNKAIKKSKVYVLRYAAFATRPSRQNAKAIIRTLFQALWKALDRAEDLVQKRKL